MIDFKKPELEDKKWMDPLIAAGDMRGCHINFTNIFAWSGIYHYRVAQVKDYLVVKGQIEDRSPYYFFPAGPGEGLKEVFKAIKEDAATSGHPFMLAGISPENRVVMEELFPEHFEYQVMRDNFDYLYLLEKLVTLSGNKLHSKRNHINRFKEKNDWSFELITLHNIAECWEMNLEWCKINAQNGEDTENDSCAVRRCFKNYFDLGLEGGLIRVEGRVIAFTVGGKLNSDTYDIHIEKAFGDIQGAYQMINREFAEYIQTKHPEIVYVNREDDMGLEGLRKAKLSYHPVQMLEKYLATYVEGSGDI